MTNAPFIRDMQAWVWKRFPSRQLSATDIYYVLKWAESGVPASIFTDAFEHLLKSRACEFETNGKLSTLRFEAGRIIADYQKSLLREPNVRPVTVDDPYETALSRIAQAGRDTQNPLLQAELRRFYKSILEDKSQAQHDHPEYSARIEAFYLYKSQAILAWDKGLDALLENCARFLSDEERLPLQALTPQEKFHCIPLSEDARELYKKHIFHKKLAEYFTLSSFLEPL
ncbi:MAG: hypothetical protein IJ165_02110 [Proteobacteria bacterium]|nr:hypothetical protein [Pseudomonadota bacterium]